MNDEQSAFLEHCQQALRDGRFRRVVLSHGKKKAKVKHSFTAVQGEKHTLIKAATPQGERVERLDHSAFMDSLRSLPSFSSATLNTADGDWLYAENRKGVASLTPGRATMGGPLESHNRERNYVLRQNRPYLARLGVADGQGRITRKYHAKFRQIAAFVEIIQRDMGAFVRGADRPITLLDLGCGKGYLTFAAYDWLRENARHEPAAEGVDLKKDVIAHCNAIADDLGFDGLNFTAARIDPDQSRNLDVLIALHACDTATDDALALGAKSHMQFFFCAPCCQAQIAAQILDRGVDDGRTFDTITQFPLMRRRQADLITDTARALLMGALGYEVKFMEFTPLEHTAKNILLVGKKTDGVDRKAAWAHYERLKQEAGFQRHALEDNLSDLLKAALAEHRH
ncbi:MAG: SAM-dependent methyltransferase [Pseudomonadota bacterium]